MMEIQVPEKALSSKHYPSLTTIASCIDPKYELHCGIGTKPGYKIVAGQKLPIHDENEDVSYPPCSSFTNFSSNLDKSKLFILADGHGGAECANFVVNRAQVLFQDILQSKEWNLTSLDELGLFRKRIEAAFDQIDQEFCAAKTQQFQDFQAGHLNVKPIDDGCTLVVNCIVVSIFGKWFINCNVGDSRTIVNTLNPDNVPGTKLTMETSRTEFSSPILASQDHNTHHKAKMRFIAENGGKFLSPMALFIDPVFIESLSPTSYTNPLFNCRIFRPDSAELKSAGVSHKRTLNLTSTIGDLLFKIEPAIMSCKPDINVLSLDRVKRPLFILAATDGLFDHMRVQEGNNQAALLSEFIQSQVVGAVNPADGIQNCVRMLTERSLECEPQLFATDHKRVDDICCQLIVLN